MKIAKLECYAQSFFSKCSIDPTVKLESIAMLVNVETKLVEGRLHKEAPN